MDNKIRVKRIVALSPGIHLRELQRILQISFNSVRYHVARLIETGEIMRVEEGGYSRLYPAGTDDMERTLFSVIQSDTNRKILAVLANRAEMSNRQLCESTGLAKSTISEHISSLIGRHLVSSSLAATGLVYRLEQPEQVASLLARQNQNLLEKASQKFTDLWDF